jgi:hypothetical protein
MDLYLLKILKELNVLRKHAKREDHYRVIKTSMVIEKYIKLAIIENNKKDEK